MSLWCLNCAWAVCARMVCAVKTTTRLRKASSSLLVDKNNDYRKSFDKWWRDEWKQLRFPEQGLIFDYLIDPETNQIVPWTDRVIQEFFEQGDAEKRLGLPVGGAEVSLT